MIINTDCTKGLDRMEAGTADLVFADPPFNIGYKYDTHGDSMGYNEYLDWCEDWIGGVYGVLECTGSFWLAIGDRFVAELKLICQTQGFHFRSWVIWYYTFGVNCARKFSRSHTHLLHFTKHPDHFTFNADTIRVPSARQLVYNDKRANPKGRLPDDTWMLRPQDMTDSFQALDDTWHLARVCGTFRERQGWHGCQMPEKVLERIVRVSSNPGDLVVDPFAGSGTTCVVAKKLGRREQGFEISSIYTDKANERLANVTKGDNIC